MALMTLGGNTKFSTFPMFSMFSLFVTVRHVLEYTGFGGFIKSPRTYAINFNVQIFPGMFVIVTVRLTVCTVRAFVTQNDPRRKNTTTQKFILTKDEIKISQNKNTLELKVSRTVSIFYTISKTFHLNLTIMSF